MARNNRHNAAFVVGSILGAVVGAGAALWKTPYTGEELRQKLTGSGSGGASNGGSASVAATPSTEGAGSRSVKDKVLSTVEKTLAPIVGVELGKTANGSGGASTSTSTSTTTTPKVVEDPNIQVNAEQGRILRHPHSWKGYEGSESSPSSTGTGTIGLSQDRVDADKWASAYSGGSSSEETAVSQPIASAPTPAPAEPAAPEAPADQGRLLRHPHSWKGYDSSEVASSEETGSLGLSRDRVDASKWAEAYGGNSVDSSAATSDSPSRSGNVREPSSMSGQGADPAYPGDDGDAERHAPVDRGAPESVTPVSQGEPTRDGRETVAAGGAAAATDAAADAASVDQLTTPQVDLTPAAAVEVTERAMHPFPKLGGKE